MKNTSIDYYRGLHKQLVYDTAASNNGKCCICKKEIPKGTPIFWYWDKFKKYKKGPSVGKREATDLNIKRKICFRCSDSEIFNHLLEKYGDEIKKVKSIRKSFKRSLSGKKCKRAIENIMALEELQKEDFAKNFDYNG
jgi:hypothetical protein